MSDAQTVQFKIWRGDANGGAFHNYTAECSEGMVVLDAVHQIQRTQANDLACRWNCKAGKCGSCSAEVNGMPKLMCMARLSELPIEKPITIEPMKAFPILKDLITDVSWNFLVKRRIKPFKPRAPDAPDGTWRMQQADIDRVQEFRKCIRSTPKTESRNCETRRGLVTATSRNVAPRFVRKILRLPTTESFR